MAVNHPIVRNLPDNPVRRRPGAADFDRRLGAAIRARRILLGLTQQQMAELIGVTYQQAHKYEKGINRVSAARLATIYEAFGGWTIAEALSGLDPPRPQTASERRLIELAANLAKLDERQAAAVAALVRALASDPEGGE
jgi:transcriptional regulator with XRE-family HTH domain